ncbi:hypothetical protein C8Q72DRAFT_879327 [Fomitopsis betulina]|nr:hypothetical protein C8Q72DRAFT_879327 [Fomitopsis betulina]
MSVASQLMLDAANAGRSMFFSAEPGTLSVNSNLSLDWQSVDFGFYGRAKFPTAGVNKWYLRVFRAKPGLDTIRSVDLDELDVEISLEVPTALQEKVANMLVTRLASAFDTVVDR